MRNPFADDVFGGELTPTAQVATVHADALERLSNAVPIEGGAPLGRAVVLSAPRAGFGKTHLVTRFASDLPGRAVVIPLTFDLERPPRWQGILWEVLEKLHRDQSHRSGLTMLDETSRFLFARINQRLIEEHRIPCAHPEEAVAALERNYLEMFDFSSPTQIVAQWFGEHFERLSPLSGESLAPLAQIEPASAVFWLRVLMTYAQAAGEPAEKRIESLRWAVSMASAPSVGPGGMAIIQETSNTELSAKEKLRDFGRVLGLYRPIVFVIDHLDVFFRDGQAGLRIAYFVSELRRLVPRSLSVVCVNQDLWEATFRSQLPSALEDRLTGGFLQLDGLDSAQAAELVNQRAGAAGLDPANSAAFVDFLRLGDLFALNAGRPVSPRALLRYSAGRWEAFFRSHAGAAPADVTEPPSPASPAAPAVATGQGADVPGASTDSDASIFADLGATSVVGDETLDTIAHAIEAMADDGPVNSTTAPLGTAPSPPPASRSAFQELKERLDSLRQVSRPDAPPSAKINGAIHNDLASVAFIENFRRHAMAPLSPGLDWERLADLLRFAGEHSPAIRVAEVSIPGASGVAIQWLSPDAEILFGLEPATRPTFWSALTAHAAQRVKQNGGLPVKVVVFGESAAGYHPLAADWQPGGGPFSLDLIEISAADLAGISAACELISQCQSGVVPTSTSEVAAVIARELESIWRRITRLPAAVR